MTTAAVAPHGPTNSAPASTGSTASNPGDMNLQNNDSMRNSLLSISGTSGASSGSGPTALYDHVAIEGRANSGPKAGASMANNSNDANTSNNSNGQNPYEPSPIGDSTRISIVDPKKGAVGTSANDNDTPSSGNKKDATLASTTTSNANTPEAFSGMTDQQIGAAAVQNAQAQFRQLQLQQQLAAFNGMNMNAMNMNAMNMNAMNMNMAAAAGMAGMNAMNMGMNPAAMMNLTNMVNPMGGQGISMAQSNGAGAGPGSTPFAALSATTPAPGAANSDATNKRSSISAFMDTLSRDSFLSRAAAVGPAAAAGMNMNMAGYAGLPNFNAGAVDLQGKMGPGSLPYLNNFGANGSMNGAMGGMGVGPMGAMGFGGMVGNNPLDLQKFDDFDDGKKGRKIDVNGSRHNKKARRQDNCIPGSLEHSTRPKDVKWMSMLNLLKTYRAEHGDCIVPRGFGPNPKLASWVAEQRKQYKLLRDGKPSNISTERVRLLEEVGFAWNAQEAAWARHFHDLKDYKARFGDCLVPLSYSDRPQLGLWVKEQRRHYMLLVQGRKSHMTESRIAQLESIGFVWDSHEATWWDRYNDLKAYRDVNGDCMVPTKYGPNPRLGTWVHHQRRQYRKLRHGKSSHMTQERMEALASLGFCWSPRGTTSKPEESLE